MRDVLFMRKYPTALARGSFQALTKQARSAFGSGQREMMHGHGVVFFFPGYGEKIRTIPSKIINDINTGVISDIVDVGAGGALDPQLKVGDLVVSDGEVSVDGEVFPGQRSRTEVETIVKVLADEFGSAYYKQTMVTTNKIIASRTDRLNLFERTGAGVVQMEHRWFLERIKSLVAPEIFSAIHVSHVEMIADEVPDEHQPRIEGLKSFVRAVNICVLRNDHYLGKIKVRLLSELLSA